jgi:SHS family lactate transporter-like MFS transporter
MMADTHGTSLEKVHWNSVVTGAITMCFDSFDLTLISYVLVDIQKSFDLPLATVTLVFLFTTAARWLGALLIGDIAARIGRKKALICALAVVGCATVGTGLSPNFIVLLIMRLGVGLGVGGLYSSAGAMITEAAGNKRGLASGIFIVGWFLGSTLSPFAFYLLVPSFGWRGLFAFGGISLLVIPYVIFTLPESPVWIAERNRVQRTVSRQQAFRPFWKLFAPGFLGVTLMLVCLEYGNFFSSSSGNLLPTFLETIRHASRADIALIGSLASFASMFGSLGGGWASDKLGRKRNFILIFSVIWIPIVATFLIPNIFIIIVANTVFGFINGALGGSLAVFENEQYPTDLRAAGYGFSHNLGALGGSFGPLLSAALAVRVGLTQTLILIPFVGVALGLLSMVFARETRNIALVGSATEPQEGHMDTIERSLKGQDG